ncbi:MAG: hypothetical protein FJ319_00055 [SAR202 cluster bacterium]|nr:hypothetical protein [SAR202 cluster bacterium]
MPELIYLEIEQNPNCDYMPMQVYDPHLEAVPVRRVRIEDPGHPFGVYEVTGWSSERGGTPCPAMYAPIMDSGAAEAHLVYGGDWGVRLRPEGSNEPWDVSSPRQWGEPYVIRLNKADILPT